MPANSTVEVSTKTPRRRGRKPGCRKTGGRIAGTPNRATATAREAISLLVDSNIHKLQGWLDEIADEQGALAAWQCLVSLVEFAVPKLMRSELRVTPPACDSDAIVVSDPAEAARVYERVIKGELAPEAVRFAALPAPESVAEAAGK